MEAAAGGSPQEGQPLPPSKVIAVGIALAPSYASIGPAAPLLLLLFRLLQGFALGGELGASTACLVEAAPLGRRGLYVAIQYATQDVAVLLSGAVGYFLSTLLSPGQLGDWGWRVAFGLGASVVPLGLWLRRTLPETHAGAARVLASPQAQRPSVRLIALGMLLLAASGIGNYVLIYITTYAQDSLKLGAQAGFLATFILGAAQFAADLSSGLLSDRFGRRPVMLAGLTGLMLLVVPTYASMNAMRAPWAMYLGMAVLGVLLPIASGPMIVSLAESLPKNARAATLATMYAVALTCFGGTTQFVIQWLIQATGSALAPAWYMSGATALGLCGALLLAESAPRVGLRSPRPAVLEGST